MVNLFFFENYVLDFGLNFIKNGLYRFIVFFVLGSLIYMIWNMMIVNFN